MIVSRPGWVRFTRAWDWNIPKFHGRATKHFPAGTEVRLTRAQLQSALEAGAVVCIPTPPARYAGAMEAEHERPCGISGGLGDGRPRE